MVGGPITYRAVPSRDCHRHGDRLSTVPMETLSQVLKKTTAFFQSKGIDTARLDAELLFAHALQLQRLDLYLQSERPLTKGELDVLRPLVRRRGQREPLQYITGEVEFGVLKLLKLKVDHRVLIPRPETEELVECLVTSLPQAQAILDLGTGSGAIALSLAAHWENSQITAVDYSEESLQLAASNAERNDLHERVRWLRGDWFAGLAGERFDLIVSNPPYLTEEEWASAEPEVRLFEPKHALVAAEDGLADLYQIISDAPSHLAEAGILVLETGIEQHARLSAHAMHCGYAWVMSKKDLQHRPRFFLAGMAGAEQPEWRLL